MNYYQILEIENNATTSEIKKKYYQLAKKYHPDKNNGNEIHCERFKYLSEAYSTLSNPKKRYLYDLHITLNIEQFTLQFTEDELELLHTYYLKIMESTEVKLLKLLYQSLPSHIKKKLFHYQKNRKDQMIPNLKRIVITYLESGFDIYLKRKLSDVYTNVLKQIIVIDKNKIYYLFITHSDYTINLMNHLNSKIKIIIETITDTNYSINGYDLILNHRINLYQYYFMDQFRIQLPNRKMIHVDKNKTVWNNYGLHDPLKNQRGDLILYLNLDLTVDNLEEKKEKIFELFHN